MMRKLNNNGYNLMELIVVIIIISILVSLAVPKYLKHVNDAKLTVIKSDSKVVGELSLCYYMNNQKLIPNIKLSDDNVEKLKDNIRKNKVFKNGEIINDNIDNFGGPLFELDKEYLKANTKTQLKGQFLINKDHDVYYISNKSLKKLPGHEQNGEEQNKEPKLGPVKEYAMGGTEYALLEDGSVYAWGGNYNGEAGFGHSKKTPILTKLDGLPKIKQISAGDNHAAAIDIEGNLYVWGSNKMGQLGFVDIETKSVPTKTQFTNVKKVIATDWRTMVLLENGELYVMGSNRNGELGIGKKGNVVKDVFEPTKLNIDNVDDIFSKDYTSYAKLKNGDLYQWGRGDYYQFLKGNVNSIYSPEKITNFPNHEKIFVGYYGVFVIDSNDDVYNWGRNAGQLWQPGEYNNSNRTIKKPIKVEPLKNTIMIDSYINNTIALDIYGNVYVSGSNNYGQYGNSQPLDLPKTYEYQKVESLKNIKKVYTFKDKMAAIDQEGNLYVWGYKGFKEFGGPFDMHIDKPIKVTSVAKNM